MEKSPSLYVNLIVDNLTSATEFYKTLGFIQNMQFSNEQASAMMWKSEFAVMLLTHDFARGFLPAHKTIAPKNTSSALYALEFSSKEEVDTFVKIAVNA